jgi:hypothetical protein
MVMILLNLSYIPDEVVDKIRFDVPGWSEQFFLNMAEYKKQFEAKHNIEWTYQDATLEARYNSFKAKVDNGPHSLGRRAVSSQEEVVDVLRSAVLHSVGKSSNKE